MSVVIIDIQHSRSISVPSALLKLREICCAADITERKRSATGVFRGRTFREREPFLDKENVESGVQVKPPSCLL
jgi:hypothetical protein